MLNVRSALAAAVLLAIPAAALAGTIRDDVNPQVYLNLATLYPNVGRIDTVATDGRYIGSGTLIDPGWVLTAGHMVDNVTSMTFTVGGTTYTASSWISNPNWKGNLGTGTDIALVKLSSPITDIAPALRYTGTSELGSVGTFVGFGMTGTGITGATTFDGQKRAGQNVLDSYYRSGAKNVTSLLMSDFDNPRSPADSHFGSSTPISLEYLIAPGDSGGGVFAQFDAISYLVGVNSFGASWDGNTNSDYGDASGVTRVSSFNSWIDSVIAGTATGGGKGGRGKPGSTSLDATSDVAFAEAVPEPTSLGLLGLGVLSLLGTSRRRKTCS